MAGITLAQEEARLTALNAAYLKAVEAYSYSHGDKQKVNQRISDLREEIKECNASIARLTRGGIHVRGVSLSDG